MRWPWTRATRDLALTAIDLADRVDALADQVAAQLGLGEEVAEHAGHLDVLAHRLDELTPLPRPVIELDMEEKQRMQAAWANIACAYCGMCHGGTCPRVRRVEFGQVGQVHGPVRVWFWPEGRWSPPPDAVSVEEVFGSPAGPMGRESR